MGRDREKLPDECPTKIYCREILRYPQERRYQALLTAPEEFINGMEAAQQKNPDAVVSCRRKHNQGCGFDPLYKGLLGLEEGSKPPRGPSTA